MIRHQKLDETNVLNELFLPEKTMGSQNNLCLWQPAAFFPMLWCTLYPTGGSAATVELLDCWIVGLV
jgi:hypothetical protein